MRKPFRTPNAPIHHPGDYPYGDNQPLPGNSGNGSNYPWESPTADDNV